MAKCKIFVKCVGIESKFLDLPNHEYTKLLFKLDVPRR
jgi:hypothetical protein